MLIDLREKGREEERERGGVEDREGEKPERYITHALTGDQTHELSVHGMMLQLTQPPWPGLPTWL